MPRTCAANYNMMNPNYDFIKNTIKTVLCSHKSWNIFMV
jgi:hypothetical protein